LRTLRLVNSVKSNGQLLVGCTGLEPVLYEL
jgi:hypothetical protein